MIYEYNQQAVDAEVARQSGFIEPYEVHQDSENIARSMLLLESQIQQGRKIYVDYAKAIYPRTYGLGLRWHLERPQEEIDAEVAAIRAQVEAAEQARVEASRQAHIEAQVAAAVAAHEAEQARKAQQATDKVAEKARAAAIAALEEIK